MADPRQEDLIACDELLESLRKSMENIDEIILSLENFDYDSILDSSTNEDIHVENVVNWYDDMLNGNEASMSCQSHGKLDSLYEVSTKLIDESMDNQLFMVSTHHLYNAKVLNAKEHPPRKRRTKYSTKIENSILIYLVT